MIREITESDIEIINSLSSYKVTLGINPFNKCMCITLAEEIIGYIEYAHIYDKGELNYIFIIPKYRNKGYASKLLNFMFEDLRSVKNITLEVSVNNTSAINLYKKNNFQIVSTRERYYNGVDGYLMLKEVGK